MKCNVGRTDKIIRWVIGIVIAFLGLYFKLRAGGDCWRLSQLPRQFSAFVLFMCL
jgi:hypothetical protein